VGCEHRNACARKSFGHHLQRDGFSGPGGTGDEAVTIGKSERQPGRLFSLADENLLVSVDRPSFGSRHCIAFSRARRNTVAKLYSMLLVDWNRSKSTIEAPLAKRKTHLADAQSASVLSFVVE